MKFVAPRRDRQGVSRFRARCHQHRVCGEQSFGKARQADLLRRLAAARRPQESAIAADAPSPRTDQETP